MNQLLKDIGGWAEEDIYLPRSPQNSSGAKTVTHKTERFPGGLDRIVPIHGKPDQRFLNMYFECDSPEGSYSCLANRKSFSIGINASLCPPKT
jgi:hypothetical protein